MFIERLARRVALRPGLAAAAAAIALAPPALRAATTPNIVWIMADDLGIGDTGVTGQNARLAAGLPAFATPNIDAIANAGVQFRNMYAGGPTCSPSRAALLTGISIGHSVIQEQGHDNDLRSGAQDMTWGQALQQAGYATAMFGKWHVGGFSGTSLTTIRNPGAIPTSKGFETAYGTMTGGYHRYSVWTSNGTGGMIPTPLPPDPTWPGPGVPTVNSEDETTNHIVDYIRNQANGSRPFAVYAPFAAPHEPLNEPPLNHPYKNMPWPEPQRSYAGMVWNLDQHVGQILAALEDPNNDGSAADSVMDNTIVVFTSDNGPLWPQPWLPWQTEFFDSNSIYTGHKASPQGGGVRVPFFMRWDGVVQPGTIENEYAGFVDVLPTIAEIAGQDVPLGIDGQSFLPLVTGQGTREQTDAYLWTAPQDFGTLAIDGWALQVGQWKLVKYKPTNTFKLFNLATNPAETIDLAASRPDIKAALTQIAYDEGADREPTIPWVGNPAVAVTQNTYFTQYKSWAPAAGSTNFAAAGNWSGGQQYDRPGSPEAANWNTGPADNWVAVMNNATAAPQQVTVDASAAVLAMEVRGSGAALDLTIPAGVELAARNGLRISSGGRLNLHGGKLTTINDVEVRDGAQLTGAGVIDGRQSVIAGIAEFAGQGLFEPQLVNGGDVVVGEPGLPGVLTVHGDFTQTTGGDLFFDLFASSGGAGVAFDHLAVDGTATLGGVLHASLDPLFTPQVGDAFEIISAGGGVTGFFDAVSLPGLAALWSWNVVYSQNTVTLHVIENAAEILSVWSGGPLGDFVSIGAGQQVNVANRINVGLNGSPGTLRVGPGGEVTAGVKTVIDSAGLLILDGGTLATPVLERAAGGTLDWRWGTLRLTGSTTLSADGPLGPAPTVGQAQTLEVVNSLSVAGASLAVATGGRVDAGDGVTIGPGGVLTLSGGTLETDALQSQGTGAFDWQTGTLRFRHSHALVGGGPLGAAPLIAAGRTLEVADNLSLGAGVTTIGVGGVVAVGNATTIESGATLELAGGALRTATLAATGSGQFVWSSGALEFTGDATLAAAGPWGAAPEVSDGRTLKTQGALTVSDVALTLGAGGVVEARGGATVGAGGVVTLVGGRLETPALDVLPGGAFDWQSGVLHFTDSYYLTGAGPLGAAPALAGGRVLEVAGSFDVGDIQLTLNAGGLATATGAATIGNGGVLTLDGGELAAADLLVGGDGQFQWLSGVLRFSGDYALTPTGVLGAEVDVTAPRTLAVDGDLLAAAPLAIAGRVEVAGTTTVTAGGELTLAGGTLRTESLVASPASILFTAGSLEITGPDGLQIGAAGPLGPVVQVHTGMSLAATQAVVVDAGAELSVDGSGAFNTGWLVVDGGTFRAPSLAGVGELVLNSGLVDVAGGAVVAAGEPLGATHYFGTGQTFRLGGQLDVGRADSPATFAVGGDGVVEVGGATVLHAGSVLILDGGLFSTAAIQAEANSSFAWQAGKLNFTNGLTLDAGGYLGPTIALAADQTLGVDGTLSIAAGSLAIGLGAAVEGTGPAVLGADGAATLAGGSWSAPSFAAASTSVIDWQSGEIRYTGDAAVAGNGFVAQALGGALQLGLGRQLTVDGTATLAAPLTLAGGTLRVGALQGAAMLTFGSGALELTATDLHIGVGGLLGVTPELHASSALRVTQQIVVDPGAVVTIASGATLDGGQILNQGEIALDGVSAVVTTNGLLTNAGMLRGRGRVGGAVANAPGGELYVQGGRRMTFTGPSFVNQGRVSAVGVAVDPAEITFEAVAENSAGSDGIHASYARLRFNGGLNNAGLMSFAAGDNYIFGDILNTGQIVVSGGATATFYDDVAQNGVLRVSQAGATTSVAVFLGDVTGMVGVEGGGDVFFEGGLGAGESVALINFESNVHLAPTARLALDLGGLAGGVEYDQISVTGLLALDGTLDLSVINGFNPTPGDAFTLLSAAGGISGAFDSVVLPATLAGMNWRLTYSANEVSLLAIAESGDFDSDARIDGFDFLAWQRGFGMTSQAERVQGDANSDGVVDQTDFGVWRDQFGGAAALAAGAVVPEPHAWVLSLAAAGLVVGRRRRGRRAA